MAVVVRHDLSDLSFSSKMPLGTSNVARDSRDGLGSELPGENSGELIGEAGSYKGERNEPKERTGNF